MTPSLKELLSDLWATVSRKKTSDLRPDAICLNKELTVVDLTCLGLASSLGTGVYVILGHVSREHAGPSVVLSFLMAAVASFLAGLCYAELGSRFPRAGSAYVYAYATMGELAGFLIGWTMILELAIGAAVAGKAWFQYMDALTNNSVSHALEDKIGVINLKGLDRTVDLPAFLFILMVTAAIAISVKSLCVFNNFLVIVGFLVIAGMVFVGLYHMDAENWTRGPGFFPSGISGVVSAASTGCYTFVGYDIMASSAGESLHHGRTLSTAVVCSFLIGLFACFTMAVASTLLVPFSLFTDRAPLVHIFTVRGIASMKYFVVVGAFCGLLSATFATIFALSRLLHRMAGDGVLFSGLSRVSGRTGTPWPACIVGGLIAACLALIFDIRVLVDLLGLGTIVCSVAVAISILCLRYSPAELHPAEHRALSRDSTAVFSDLASDIGSEYMEIAPPPKWEVKRVKPLSPRLPFPDSRETTELLTNRMASYDHDHDEVDTSTIEQGGRTLPHGATNGNNVVHCRDYGSSQSRQMAVEYVNDSFISSIMDLSNKQGPNSRSCRLTACTVIAMVGFMAVVAIITTHRPEIFVRVSYWPEVVTCLSLAAIIVLAVLVLQQPKNSLHLRHKVPCIPALPLGAIWLHVQLLATLPFESWIRAAVWTFMGLVIYGLHGSRHSRERASSEDDQEVVLSEMADGNSINSVQSVHQDAVGEDD